MVRVFVLISALIALQGCTVGWYSLRDSDGNVKVENIAERVCPTEFELKVRSSRYTNTFGGKESRSDYVLEIERKLRLVTENTIKTHNCSGLGEINSLGSNKLNVEVIEQKYLSALPQEWLTGLSFGLIPSWGTRPEQWKFKFESSGISKEFVVDDTRFNHIVAFPVFWLSFPLMNVESKYEKALVEFIKTPNNGN